MNTPDSKAYTTNRPPRAVRLRRIRERSAWHRPMILNPICGLVALGLLIAAGCAANDTAARMDRMHMAYKHSDYREAYQQALTVMRSGNAQEKYEAAYMAGMSAYKLNETNIALPHLTLAAQSQDQTMAGDAMTVLGVIYSDQNRYDRAAAAFLKAAELLTTPQERANAYLHAAAAQQRLGLRAQAQTNFSLARSLSTDTQFRQRATNESQATGYTLQAGAYNDPANAHRAADTLANQTQHLNLGKPRVIQTIDGYGKDLYLIQLGRFSSLATASAAKERLRPTTAMIVPLGTH